MKERGLFEQFSLIRLCRDPYRVLREKGGKLLLFRVAELSDLAVVPRLMHFLRQVRQHLAGDDLSHQHFMRGMRLAVVAHGPVVLVRVLAPLGLYLDHALAPELVVVQADDDAAPPAGQVRVKDGGGAHVAHLADAAHGRLPHGLRGGLSRVDGHAASLLGYHVAKLVADQP